jgi:nucleoside-diphosphate-sugar epimerase
VITGASGRIGTLLRHGLTGRKLVGLDLPEHDLRDGDLMRVFRPASAVVHLAWNTLGEDWFNKQLDPGNTLMAFRVYEAALAASVPRVIVASSVHADAYRAWDGGEPLAPDREPWPDSPYGAGKLMLEALGRYFARHRGLEVICIRFGGVYPDDELPADARERSVWLSNADCVGVVQHCLDLERVPGRFQLLYAVSGREPASVDVTNELGWRPGPG